MLGWGTMRPRGLYSFSPASRSLMRRPAGCVAASATVVAGGASPQLQCRGPRAAERQASRKRTWSSAIRTLSVVGESAVIGTATRRVSRDLGPRRLPFTPSAGFPRPAHQSASTAWASRPALGCPWAPPRNACPVLSLRPLAHGLQAPPSDVP